MKKIIYCIFILIFCRDFCLAEDTDRSLEITANTMEWDKAAEKAIAIGNAVATQGDKTIEADRIIANLNKKSSNKEISSLKAEGSVIFYRTGEKITSKEALYDLEKDVITLKGDVNFQKEDNIMFGEQLIINFKTGVSQLIGGNEKKKVKMKYNNKKKED